MGLAEIDRSPFRDDSGWIDLFDRPIIDHVVARLHRGGDARDEVQLAHVVQQVRIVGDAPLVAFEQGEISDVETNQRREQTPIGLGDLPAHQISLPAQPRFEVVERGE